MRDVIGSSLFDVLRDKHGAGFDAFIAYKIEVVSGELTAPNFGLPDVDFIKLGGVLDLIINSAASVNFREAMDQALQIKGTILAQLKKIKIQFLFTERLSNLPPKWSRSMTFPQMYLIKLVNSMERQLLREYLLIKIIKNN